MEIIYSSLISLFRGLFGPYTPVSYIDGSGVSVIPSGFSGVNFEYVLTVGIFCLVVFEVFRLLGIFLSRH